MRAFACGSVLLTAFLASGSLLAQVPPAPLPPPVLPPAPPSEPTPPPAAPAPSTIEETPSAPPALPQTLPASPRLTAPLDERRPATTLAIAAQRTEPPLEPPSRFARNYDALRPTLEARFGFNARLSSSFDPSAHEQLLDSTFGFDGYLSWSREFALGLEFEDAGLGHVRGLNGESAFDTEYSALGAWLGARVFPWRSERWDVFVNLRLGMVFQHVAALGTHQETTSIAVPPTSFSCSETDGPGLGLGGAVGAALRLSRHFAVLSRIDATAERLTGDELGSCADGIGSVTTVSGSVGLAYEFEASK
jgi:hypothetical protein